MKKYELTNETEMIGTMIAIRDELLQVVEVLPLEAPEQEQHAAAFVQAIESLIRRSEVVRKDLVKPHKDAAKKIDEAFRGPRNDLKALGDKIRFRLQEAAEKRERLRLEAIATVQKATTIEAANTALATVVEAPPTPGVSMRWRWEIVGMTPSQVPDEYKIVDVQKLKGLCKIADGGGAEPSVPGVVFERKAHSVVRSGR